MIDSAMLARLMVVTGFYPSEAPAPVPTQAMLTLAKAIWAEAQKDQREACASQLGCKFRS